MAHIRLVSVSKKYYKNRPLIPGASEGEEEVIMALDGVNLEIRDGETMSILGPSGCGKTTLLRVVAGLEKPDGGYVLFNGEDMENVPPRDRHIGIVFQNYALYPHMESQQNIGFFFKLHDREDEIPERVHAVSKIMGIGFDKLLDRRPPTLSGGEQQRVAVARCIARDPSLFLFDEPLSNLDAKLRVQTRGELKRILARYATTGLYVTHDQYEAFALGDRLAVMNLGRVEQVGTYTDLYYKPVNLFVAEFLGVPPMNTFRGYVNDRGGWSGDDFQWPIIRPGLEEGDRVVVGIRPEHIRVEESAHSVPAVVDLIEPLFAERAKLLYTKIGLTRCNVRVGEAFPAKVGDTLPLTFQLDELHFFDTRTGARLG
ncbi:MAG: ABC transporter ATP-binding protein [Anaerolineae bacterium]|nr:ABC transporter ATP-binding protein [Anaerolineae bacterium]